MSCPDCSGITLFRGADGNGIDTIAWQSNSGASPVGTQGTTDTYLITYTDATTDTFVVTNGADGAAGDDGAYGGFSSEWVFDNGTTLGTAVTQLRFDNATLASVTGMWVNETNADSTNLAGFLSQFNNSGDFGLIRIAKKSDSNVFWLGTVTATSDLGSEHDITLTHVSSNGTFTNADPIILSFATNGADGAAGADLYDSGWQTISNYNGTTGLPAFTNWTHPQLRVVGKHVYIAGRILIPLAAPGTPGTLITDAATYSTTHADKVTTCTAATGGYTVNSATGAIESQNPIIPADLQPTVDYFIDEIEIIARAVQSTGTARDLNLTTIANAVLFRTTGKLYVTSFLDALDSASGGTPAYNSPLHMQIMNVDIGEKAIDYTNYKQQYTTGTRSYEIVDSGDGYTDGSHTGVTTTSDITGGTGLIFTVVVDASKIVSITQTAAGTGYVDGETVTLDATSGAPGIGTPTANIIATVRLDINADDDDRVIAPSVGTYPATFDGLDVGHFGGFIVPFTFSYPLGDSVTEAQIIAAIALL